MGSVKLQLFANNTTVYANTYKDSSITIDRRLQNFEQIESAQGEASGQTFRIPLEPNLIDFFGDLTDPKQEPLVDIRRSIKCNILIDGAPRYFGRVNVVGIYTEPKEIELIFVGGQSSIKSELINLTLPELFDGETLDYTATEINSFYSNPDTYISTNGYAYPLVDYGQRFTFNQSASAGTIIGSSFDANTVVLTQADFKPAVSFRKCLEKIEEVAGLTITVDASADDLLDQFILLHNNDSKLAVIDTNPLEYTGYLDRTTTTTYTKNIGVAAQNQLIDFNQATNYNTVVMDAASDEYTAQVTGIHKFKLFTSFVVTNNQPAGGSFAFENIIVIPRYRVNSGQPFVLGSIQLGVLINGGSRTFASTEDFEINLTAGDRVDLRYSFGGTDLNGVAPYSVDFQQQTGMFFECVESPSIAASSEVVISDNFPDDMNAWDHVVKTIINQCNGITVPDENELNTYDIVPWVEFIDIGTTYFLSENQIKGSSLQIEPTSTTGAKSIEFKYLEGEDFYSETYRKLRNENYGELIIDDLGNDFSKDTFTVDIPYQTVPVVKIARSSIVIPKLYDDEFKTVKTKPILLSYQGDIFFNIWSLNDIVSPLGTDIQVTETPFFGNFDSAVPGFTGKSYVFGQSPTFYTATGYPDNTLYRRFWETYLTEIYGERGRRIEMRTSFKQYELQNFKFNEKVIYNGAVYRFIEFKGTDITDQTSEQTTVMTYRKPLEKIDIAPFYPYDVLFGIVQWKDSSDDSDLGDGSGADQTDLEESAIAYGFNYDSVQQVATQRAIILTA